MNLYKLEKENLTTVLQKNNAIVNSLSDSQLKDLDEWKEIFYAWHNILLSIFEEEFRANKIPIQIKMGQFSVSKLKDYLEKKYSTLSDLEKIEIKGEIEYKCSIYSEYLKLIEEFNQWTKTNNNTVDLEYLFNKMENETKENVVTGPKKA